MAIVANKIFLFTTTILVFCLTQRVNAERLSWTGTFEYYKKMGYDGSGTATTGAPVSYDIILKINQNNECSLSATGYDTDELVNCQPITRPDGGIDITFASIPVGSNEIGVDGVSNDHPGDVLFSLIPAPKTGITTIWKSWRPVVADKISGNYFIKWSNKKI